MTSATLNNRIDWQTERNRIDLTAVTTSLLGPPPGRTGEHGRRLWWHCPFHEDHNPSFMVDPTKPWWRCFGCGEHGDAATLLMKLENLTFPEAVARLTGGPIPPSTTRSRAVPRPKPPEAPDPSRGLPERDARGLVVDAEARLWSSEGVDALSYLTDVRKLTPETIRAARLGWTPAVRIPTKEGGTYSARGWVIPWHDKERLCLVKLRQPEGDRPKYAEAFRDRPSLYPSSSCIIRPGYPLIIVEGEFDALLLGQELAGLATVVTLGGTGSTKPDPAVIASMLPASPWFIATDADDAGDKAAARWEGTRAHRVRPPKPYKDWTEACQRGINLRRWWNDRMMGVEDPPLFVWGELAEQRWGPAIGDPEPGIIRD